MPAALDGIGGPRRSLEAAPVPFADGAQHLLAEFERLRLLLHREVLRLRALGQATDDRFRGLYVSDEQVDAILRDHYASQARGAPSDGSPPALVELDRRIHAVSEEIEARAEASLQAGVWLPLLHLDHVFALSPFEREALRVCVAGEADLRFETLYSYAQNDVTRKRPTADLVLRLFCCSPAECLQYRAAFSPEGNLVRHALVRFVDVGAEREPALLARPLRAEERIVEFLLGHSELDHRLRPFTSFRNSARALADLHLPAALVAELERATQSHRSSGSLFWFHGRRGVGRKTAAGAMSASLGRSLLVADLQQALASELPLPLLLSLLHREAQLCGANLYLDRAEALSSDDPSQVQRRLQFVQCLHPSAFWIFVGSDLPWPPSGASDAALHFDFPVPGFAHRASLWEQAVRETACPKAASVKLPTLAEKFILSAGEIYGACAQAAQRALLGGQGKVSLADLEAAARSQSNHDLRRLAQKVEGLSDWNDLVLPPRGLRQLREICATHRHRQRVYTEWGFERKCLMKSGLSVLFHGPSGTGKTMAAGILARELGLDLYKIDLSTVVSKYIGETEKQLSRIFREAQSSNAILFFDEADALFGKRSEVKDAHDRYANIEVAYLLQKMEEYEGVVILATNFRKNMDEAFTRRIQHVVEFPFPDAEHRERIWRNLLPAAAPQADNINCAFLGQQFEFTGGNIRSAVLAAAFLAAEEGSAIRMEHLIQATSRELQKLGKLSGRAEFREYYEFTRLRE